MEREVHGLDFVALVALLGGGEGECGAAQDEGDSWKCVSHIW